MEGREGNMKQAYSGNERMKKLIVDIPMLKKQYCAVLHTQRRKGATRRVRTLF